MREVKLLVTIVLNNVELEFESLQMQLQKRRPTTFRSHRSEKIDGPHAVAIMYEIDALPVTCQSVWAIR